MRSPVSVYPRILSGKKWWYARFWDEATGRYIKHRPLDLPYEGRRGGRDLAMKKAEKILPDVMRARDPLVHAFVMEFWAARPAARKGPRIFSGESFNLDFHSLLRRASSCGEVLRLDTEPQAAEHPCLPVPGGHARDRHGRRQGSGRRFPPQVPSADHPRVGDDGQAHRRALVERPETQAYNQCWLVS